MRIPKDRKALIEPSDKFIASYPRSGNTWMRFLVTKALLLDVGMDPDAVSQDVIVPDIHVPKHTLDLEPAQKLLRGQRLIKTHNIKGILDHVVVYIFRRPEDTLTSSFFHSLGYAEQREATSNLGIDKYTKNYYAHWRRHIQFLINGFNLESKFVVAYEQMLLDAETVLQEVMDFLELPVSTESVRGSVEANRFDKLRKLNWVPERPMFRKGVVGDAENHMSAETLAFFREGEADALYKEACAFLALDLPLTRARS